MEEIAAETLMMRMFLKGHVRRCKVRIFEEEAVMEFIRITNPDVCFETVGYLLN